MMMMMITNKQDREGYKIIKNVHNNYNKTTIYLYIKGKEKERGRRKERYVMYIQPT